MGAVVIMSIGLWALSYDFKFNQNGEMPWWFFQVIGIGDFLFYSKDSVDGSLARLHGTGNSLGAFFDEVADGFGLTMVWCTKSLCLDRREHYLLCNYLLCLPVVYDLYSYMGSLSFWE